MATHVVLRKQRLPCKGLSEPDSSHLLHVSYFQCRTLLYYRHYEVCAGAELKQDLVNSAQSQTHLMRGLPSEICRQRLGAWLPKFCVLSMSDVMPEQHAEPQLCCCRIEAGSGELGAGPGVPHTRASLRDSQAAARCMASAERSQLGHCFCHPEGAVLLRGIMIA